MLRIISGKYKGRKIREAGKELTRPTTDKNKGILFNILGQYFEGGRALDLFAGSGALGIEALSRGMEEAYFVDKNREPFQLLKANLEDIGIPLGNEAFLFQEDALAFLATHGKTVFDLIFLDPPYALDIIPEVIRKVVQNTMLSEGGVIVAETDKKTELPAEIGGIMKFREVVEGNSKFSLYRWRETL